MENIIDPSDCHRYEAYMPDFAASLPVNIVNGL